MKSKTSIDKIPIVIKYLAETEKACPSNIAQNINSDIRTTNKILSNLSDVGLTSSTSFSTGQKTYSTYSLTKDYKKVYKKLGGK